MQYNNVRYLFSTSLYWKGSLQTSLHWYHLRENSIWSWVWMYRDQFRIWSVYWMSTSLEYHNNLKHTLAYIVPKLVPTKSFDPSAQTERDMALPWTWAERWAFQWQSVPENWVTVPSPEPMYRHVSSVSEQHIVRTPFFATATLARKIRCFVLKTHTSPFSVPDQWSLCGSVFGERKQRHISKKKNKHLPAKRKRPLWRGTIELV